MIGTPLPRIASNALPSVLTTMMALTVLKSTCLRKVRSEHTALPTSIWFTRIKIRQGPPPAEGSTQRRRAPQEW